MSFVANTANKHDYRTIVEIGVFGGEGSAAILAKVKNLEHLYAIDPYMQDLMNEGRKYWRASQENTDELYERVKARFEDESRITLIRKKSHEAIDDIPEVDFIYLDGSHSYRVVKEDIRLYWEKVKPGGMLAGDDCHRRSVRKAVDEFGGCTLIPWRNGFRRWYRVKE